MWNFIVYTSSRIVLEVAHDQDYCLYPDNWYTSPKLVNTLCTRTTDVGTRRINIKEFPDFMKKARLKKGERAAAFRKKQMIMKWKDKRDVVFVSTFHDDSMQDVTTKQGVNQKPHIILDYNKTMGE